MTAFVVGQKVRYAHSRALRWQKPPKVHTLTHVSATGESVSWDGGNTWHPSRDLEAVAS